VPSVRNPFTPTFGAPPPLLVGRHELLDLFQDALDEGPGSPGYATVYTGGRGVGKTVMLNATEDLARDAGFTVISETATPGFLNRLTAGHLPPLLAKQRRKIKAVNVAPVGGLELEASTLVAQHLRSMVEQVTIRTPLLITLDELQTGALAELRDLSVVLQHSIREGRRLAFCGAGLASALDELLKDKGVTFFRRADRHMLGAVSLNAVASAFQEVVSDNGRKISADVARAAAEATGGYPFMIQLIGYRSWRQHPANKVITLDDVKAGQEEANRRIGALVLEPALNDLSPVDRTFLLHMAADGGPSKMSDIAKRMGANANYASQYRLRLIAAGLIEPAGHGVVRFVLPHIRDWLRDHAAYDTLS
jgi:hypothetical protein